MKNYVIRFGNHWLQSDDHLDCPEFVSDLSEATRHTKKWAEKYVKQQLQARKHLEVFKFKDALQQQQKSGLEQVKTRWIYAFEKAVRANCKQITTDGIYINAHMYYRKGLSVNEALAAIAKSFGITKF